MVGASYFGIVEAYSEATIRLVVYLVTHLCIRLMSTKLFILGARDIFAVGQELLRNVRFHEVSKQLYDGRH